MSNRSLILICSFITAVFICFHPIFVDFSQNNGVKNEGKVHVSDEFDSLQWIRKQYNNPVKNASKSTRKVSMLYAYEFDDTIAVSLSNWNLTGYKVHCRYQNATGHELFPTFESITFPDYTIYCQKRQNAAKIGITYSTYEPFTPIPIIPKRSKKYQLSMCVTPFYGAEPKWLLLSEMLEHYRLQGVEHFYLYMHKVSLYDLKLISDYERTGEVEVHWLLERDERPGDQEWQVVHIADCLLRARSESEWTIFADLDERIVMNPEKALTIGEYVGSVGNESVGAVRFRQQWVLKTETMPEEYEGEKQLLAWLPTHRWHNSTAIGPIGHTAKCIIRPDKVLDMWVHDVTRFFPGSQRIEVGPEVGVVRHYRDQQMGDWGRVWLKGVLEFGAMRLTNYSTPLLLKRLTENVMKRVDYVYGVLDD